MKNKTINKGKATAGKTAVAPTPKKNKKILNRILINLLILIIISALTIGSILLLLKISLIQSLLF